MNIEQLATIEDRLTAEYFQVTEVTEIVRLIKLVNGRMRSYLKKCPDKKLVAQYLALTSDLAGNAERLRELQKEIHAQSFPTTRTTSKRR